MDAKQGLGLFKTLLHMCCCEWRIVRIMDRIKASSLTKRGLTRLTLKIGTYYY